MTRTVDKLLTPGGSYRCASCGADVTAEAPKCWHCSLPLGEAPDRAATPASPAFFAEQIILGTKTKGLHVETLEGWIAQAQAAAISEFKRARGIA